MNKTLILSLICLTPLLAYAQDDGQAKTLGEVTVNGAKVVQRVDGQTIYPTSVQRNAASNGYNLLDQLGLSNIRIDDAAHTVSALDGRGEVQLRINGIIVSKTEMMALNPQTIERIVFIDNPGVRYGDNIAYVIDIITRRNDYGYTLGATVTPTLTALQGDGSVYGKWNTGKSEFTLSYDFSGHRLTGVRTNETANYTLADGTDYVISRDDQKTLRKGLRHEVALTYNWADSTATVFQVSLRGALARTPENYSLKTVTETGASLLSSDEDITLGDVLPVSPSQYSVTSRSTDKQVKPVVDLYFFRQLSSRQTITANAVGTYLATTTGNYYDEGTPYQYDVDGKTSSVLGEVVYENRLKSFTLTAGLNGRYKHTSNDYTGDADSRTTMDNSSLYAFSEISGSLAGIRYALGAGASYLHYKQEAHNYDYWTFRPKVSLIRRLVGPLQLRYSFEMHEKVSRIAMISDATIRVNSMEWTMGNPDLKPNREYVHQLQLAYNTNRWQLSADVYYKKCRKPNMALYERTDDNRFVYTQTNQKEISILQSTLFAQYWPIAERLQVQAYGGLSRCFNFGYDYTHCYTSYYFVGSIVGYLGRFTLRFYTDTGNRFLEGENKGYSGSYTAARVSYKIKNWQFYLTWYSPFCNNYKANQSEIINCNLHKLVTQHDRDTGNGIALSASWRIHWGKQHRSAEKTINLNDSDSGILK
jgi:hypothetical protein